MRPAGHHTYDGQQVMSDPDVPFHPQKPAGHLEGVWLIAHDLKHSVSLLDRAVEDLQRHLVSGQAARRAHSDLRGVLAHVGYLATTLLEGLHAHGLQRAAIVLNDFIKERESALARGLDPRVSLTLRLSAPGGVVFASVPELEYVLRTLVANAAEAMPGGGELTISTGWLDRVSLPDHPTTQPRRYIRLTVSDTGDSVDRHPHSSLFEARPTDGSATEALRETVAAAVWRLNGWLIVEGEPHAGTRVHMCLPAIPDAR